MCTPTPQGMLYSQIESMLLIVNMEEYHEIPCYILCVIIHVHFVNLNLQQ